MRGPSRWWRRSPLRRRDRRLGAVVTHTTTAHQRRSQPRPRQSGGGSRRPPASAARRRAPGARRRRRARGERGRSCLARGERRPPAQLVSRARGARHDRVDSAAVIPRRVSPASAGSVFRRAAPHAPPPGSVRRRLRHHRRIHRRSTNRLRASGPLQVSTVRIGRDHAGASRSSMCRATSSLACQTAPANRTNEHGPQEDH